MRTAAFVIDQKQDFYLSLAWATMLRDRGASCRTLVILTHGAVLPEFEPHLERFDAVTVTEAPFPPSRVREIPGMMRLVWRFRRDVRAIALGRGDVVVAYSFRALVATAFIRALRVRPRFVRVRQCNREGEDGLTRRRVVVSFYWNLWNRFAGAGPMRYRWLPSSNRHGAGTFLRDPYDDEFCLTAANRAEPARRKLAWPFPVLRATGPAGSQTLVFLGERYPLVEGQPLDELRGFLQGVLDRVADLHPEHRLVFKPRGGMTSLDLDLARWELGPADTLLESLLMDDASIVKVLSFKSSGSIVASQYGCAAYVLYPLLELPADFRANLDSYFAEYRDDLAFVDDLDLVANPAPAGAVTGARATELAAPLLDLLEAP